MILTAHKFVPFSPDHVQELKVQSDQQGEWLAFKDVPSWMGLSGLTVMRDSQPIALGGVTQGHFWGMLGKDLGRSMLYVHSCAKKVLAGSDRSELETYVRSDFMNAIRWIELLGFERSGRTYPYLGNEYTRYVRQNHGSS